jgi:Spy/CpxP family protein refolding chaperone
MYTAMRWWRLAGCEPSVAWAGCGPSPRRHATHETRGHAGSGSGALGVRRPLRFLAWKLELDDEQLGELAKILGELKTERAQVDVDRARRLAAFADAVSAEPFDAGRAAEGAALRVAGAERLRGATLKALERLHALLTPDQRRTLAYLIRTGSVSL